MMYLLLVVALLSTALGATAFTSTSSSSSDGFVEEGPTPACPADLFDSALVTATCHQGERRCLGFN